MDAQSYRVDWEVALDESFEEIAFSGTARADAEHAHSVHVDLREVEPAVGFFYRFRAGTHVSPVGRMATMPLFTLPDRVVIGTVSRRGDQMALSPLLADVARSGLDLLIDLGDPMPGRPETTLEQYRSLYAASLADASSRTAHAACTWLATRSGVDISSDAARKAWWEHSAVRLPPPAPGEPFPTYRHCLVGSLVDIVLLDPTVDGSEANRLGRAQERWLTRVPARTNTAWHAIAYRGDPAVGERATQLLTAASVRNVVTLAPAGAPDGAIAWQRHEVTPERWTSATHVLDVASGRITVSDRPTEVVASPPADTTG
jgi:alkaline phosphatase D